MSINNIRPTSFYHPIKVIFLDDNREFLNTLELEFNNQINMLTISNPELMFLALDNNSDINKPTFKLMNNVNDDTPINRIIYFEVGKLVNLLYDKTRFDKVAVLVVDYDMPSINGLEFCEKLRKQKLFKIVLITEADKDTAIKAFNNGLVDKIIFKTSENLYPEISCAIHELSQRYFSEVSINIINRYIIKHLFDNELYKQLFTSIFSHVQAVEYYLIDNSGSFLFLDKNANPTWLIVRSNNELNDQLELLKGYDLIEKIMTSVAKKEKMLFLFSEKEYKKPIIDWVNYIFDCSKLDDEYYYSIIQNEITDSIDWNTVVSYSLYRKTCQTKNM